MSFNTSPIRGRKGLTLAPGTPTRRSMTTTPTKSPRLHLDSMTAGQTLNSAFGSAPNSAFGISSSLHASPILSPDASVTYSSSLVPSPEPLRGRELEPVGGPSFQLPESVLSHRLSATSLQYVPSSRTQPGAALHEAMKQNSSIIRRLSNKASKAITRRRTSSAHPNSRDVSVGPGILRRRSDSNNTALTSDILERPAFDTDSEGDTDERDDGESISVSTFDNNGATADSSPTTNTASSLSGSACPSLMSPSEVGGPVIPLALLNGVPITGVPITKVSKKKNSKRLVLALDAESGKITWDRNRPSKCIYIDDIKEIRTAEDIRQYRLDCGISAADEPRFFSILYTVPDTTQTKLMHLIADSDANFINWTTTLNAIYRHRQDSMAALMSFSDHAIRAYWDREMGKLSMDKPSSPVSSDGCLIDLSDIERMCRNIHIHVPQEVLRAKFAEADVFRTGLLNFSGFHEFVRLMRKREDIIALYRAIASNNHLGITQDEFFDFLRNTQGENVDDERASWEAVFTYFARRPKPNDAIDIMDDSPRISQTGLSNYLTSSYNVVFMKEPLDYKFDRPMNEYFISSSHNTYLTGRQLAGTSSVEGYISALSRGCRCVEIDCWDGPEGQPIVVHGKTLTSSISFREAINAINKYAFLKSNFPLWISLEVHCNPEQQRIMAKIMREVFGSKLVTEPLPSATNRLPSPSELQGRILVKTKKTQQAAQLPQQPTSEVAAAGKASGEFRGRRRGNSLPTPFMRPMNVDIGVHGSGFLPAAQPSPLSRSGQSSPVLSPGPMSPLPRKLSISKARVNTITEGEVHQDVHSNSTSDCESGSEKAVKFKQSKIVPELGCLAVYCVGVHKATPFDDAECKTFNHILSWDESVYDKQTKSREQRRAVHWHNMRYLMRVYPKPYRIGSSNFSPLAHWRRGVQMAALNWQTYDLGMQLNTAMFTGSTDQSGYVLKPRECREFQVVPNLPGESKPRELKRERKNVNFSIGVISAQQLMRPVTFADKRTLDPYVEVEVFLADDKRDSDERRTVTDECTSYPLLYRTRIVPENGFNPVFDQKFNFSFTTKFPDLVFVRLSVKLAENGRYSSSVNATASFTAKLSNLKQGYRSIPLVDVNADRYMFSTLLCEIRKEPITSVFVPCATDMPENTPKFKSIRTVFNRSANMSPKSSLDSGHS
ncbi:1-phosphatidylinositol-bisphosphate phosphodiesterase [Grosmannia clavigera kw1407]|uniref:Phosphoinositide phospholipase C n=1 Tax=Grosmannia clavigera (strain kw1407 / UAMH 11150) TaxID=655863 RepID=F0XRH2_GROCL|nr:1-phosphatidylinositol-bisphosphate phosphodiesterase [Grosmannia clavigera kw1407]EFW99981.1 1-phosphatidylinositol-bisphosphate phosphodiesterase [Grosmannia clavigera kw1407]